MDEIKFTMMGIVTRRKVVRIVAQMPLRACSGPWSWLAPLLKVFKNNQIHLRCSLGHLSRAERVFIMSMTSSLNYGVPSSGKMSGAPGYPKVLWVALSCP
jgi:hypothetical protein